MWRRLRAAGGSVGVATSFDIESAAVTTVGYSERVLLRTGLRTWTSSDVRPDRRRWLEVVFRAHE